MKHLINGFLLKLKLSLILLRLHIIFGNPRNPGKLGF